MISRPFCFLLAVASLAAPAGYHASAAQNVTIGAVTANGSFSGGVFTPTANNATVAAADINALLAGGTAVTITTGSTGSQAGNITVTSSIQEPALSSASLSLYAQGSLSLNASITVNGALALNAGGTIAQTAPLAVAGTASITAGSSDVIFNNSANDFSLVQIVAANNVVLADANSLVLGACTLTGNLTVSAFGTISQSGALNVNGAGKTASFSAGPGSNLILNNSGNDFSTLAIAAANSAVVNDINGLVLGTSTLNGNLTVAAFGTVSQSGPLVVQGNAAFSLGPSASLQLGNVNNQLSSLSVGAARDVVAVTAGALNLGSCSVQGNLNVLSAGNLVQTGPVSAAGSVNWSAPTLLLSGNTTAGTTLGLAGLVSLNGDTSLTGNPVVFQQSVTGNGRQLTVSGAATLQGDTLTLAGSTFKFLTSLSIQPNLLSIAGWTGSLNGGGISQLMAGNSAAGLTLSDLAKLRFSNPAGLSPGTYRGILLATGEIVPTPHPTLKYTRSNSQWVLSWSDTSVLEMATDAAGPYADVPGATSPYTNQVLNLPRAFFRLR